MNNEILSLIEKRNNEILSTYGNSNMYITGILEMIKKPFDKDKMSKACSEKGFNNPDSKYYKMTPEDILEAWSNKAAESCEYGKKSDEYIQGTLINDDMELWKLENNYDYDDRLKGYCIGFDQFWSLFSGSTDYEDVGGEIDLYYRSGDVLVKGRTDRMFYSPSKNKFLIIDWKTTEEIKSSNKWQKLLGPLMKFDDCEANLYTLQTQFYKTALINSYPELNLKDEDVDTRVVQFIRGTNVEKNFNVYQPNIIYDKTNIDRMIEFAWKKNQLLTKNG